MPQMLAIQPSAPQQAQQTPPPGAPGKKEQSHFSPHLEKAVSDKKPQQQTAQDKAFRNKSAATEQDTSVDANCQAHEAPLSADNYLQSLANDAAIPPEIITQNPDQTALHILDPATIQQIAPSSTAEQLKVISPVDLLNNAATTIPGEPGKSSQISVPVTILSQLPLNSTETAGRYQMTPVIAGKQDTLSNQLQNIITSARETGTAAKVPEESPAVPVSIDREFYRTLSASLSGKGETVSVPATVQAVENSQHGLFLAEGDSLTLTPGKPMQQLTGIRQDSQHQYFNTKVSPPTLADNTQNFQDNPSGDELAQQTTSSTLPSSPFSATEQTSTFSAISTMTGETTPQPATESTKPIYLPSGTIVHEQEIIQQLTERLHLSSKNMDSRINLKLHPAELGELKIDLTLKEGSIRANIVAQSQQTLEILEKNLPKLKNILESQGFDIDQIALSAESESVADFDLFDRQLFGNNDYTPAAKKGRRKDEAAFTLDDIAFAPPVTNTGVNVKI